MDAAMLRMATFASIGDSMTSVISSFVSHWRPTPHQQQMINFS